MGGAAHNGTGIDAEDSRPHRRIWAIAGPTILAGSATPLVGLIDTWAIGQTADATALAAIGVGATLFNFLFWAFGFLRMGTTGLVAQARGRGDRNDIGAEIVRALALAAVIGCVLLLAQDPILTAGRAALAPPPPVGETVETYASIRIWSAPATLAVYVIHGTLIGLARAQAALVVLVSLNILNAGFNLLFVVGLGMGAAGVALGTLIAEWAAAGIGIVLVALAVGTKPLALVIRRRTTWHVQALLKPVRVNGFLFLRTLFLMVTLSWVTRIAGTLGEAPLAASHVLATFLMLISLGLDGFAYAAESLGGAAWGAGNRAAFRRWMWRTSLWAGLAALLYSAVFLVFGNMIAAVLTDLPAVRAAIADVIPILGLLPVLAVPAYQMDGLYIAATATGSMCATMALAFGVFALTAGPLTDAHGLAGLWTALGAFLLARGLAQIIHYPWLERALPAGEKTADFTAP
ncbi:MATE family efflux transporter [Eilatimonas milleporae]|uniref:MATE family multidrug resistance protein n=1 Tax=Eilatimonas milleporae TaxID=911205 RepID=A0A3M0CFG0_9PROT|nr:MATE family efflux transporter [Eilatimonas milleporae]RMB01873.1 MATE family multidrug resistance protein [Eilatimonas milleporae]